jgi:MFS family permease
LPQSGPQAQYNVFKRKGAGLSLLHTLTADGRLLFATRCVRLFAYGLSSVVLVLFLISVGFGAIQVGLLLTLTLLGDTAISLWLTTTADRLGRRKMLLVGAGLMICAGVVFAVTSDFWLLLLAATVGVISPSGNEVGPFLSIEQAALAQTVSAERRTSVFAWYNLIGQGATALGALCGGALVQWFEKIFNTTGPDCYRPLAVLYAVSGCLLVALFTCLSTAVEVASGGVSSPVTTPQFTSRWGLGPASLPVVLRLSGLFALDAFGGGLVIQSVLAYWFVVEFSVEPATLGAIFFGANVLAAASSLAAAAVARRIGLLNTMVFTHLPSNILLMLVPLMPNLELAVLVLLLRFSISQMDVPTRQSYTMAVVRPEERSAAAGVTGVARSLGAALAQSLGVIFVGSAPFFLAGGVKILYDLLLYRSFVSVKPDGEAA